MINKDTVLKENIKTIFEELKISQPVFVHEPFAAYHYIMWENQKFSDENFKRSIEFYN